MPTAKIPTPSPGRAPGNPTGSLRGLALAVALALCAAAACGGDGGSNRNDGGGPGVHRLVILTPPGPTIGLPPGEIRGLRVQYLDPADRPVPGARVGFAIEGNGGGAILAGYDAYTDGAGVAEMALTAGAEASAFTVKVTAPNAVPVSFEVAVSEVGFTAIEVSPAYLGARSQADFVAVVVELRFDRTCEDQRPVGGDPADRQRQVAGFGSLAVFESLPVDVGYAVSVRGEGEGGIPLAWACVDVAEGQLLRGVTVRLHLAAKDVTLGPGGAWDVLTDLVLSADSHDHLRAPMEAYLPLPSPGCSFGPEQVLLDCLLDAAFPDGSADCAPESADPRAADLGSRRGKVDPLGCRGALTPGGAQALERALRESVDATGLERLSALDALRAVDAEDFARLRVRAQLRVVPGEDDATLYAWHRLQSVAFPELDPEGWIPLADLGAAPLAAASLPCTTSLGPPPTLTVPPHGLSLQPAWAAFRAAWQRHLAPAGLPLDPRDGLPLCFEGYQGPASAPQLAGCEAVVAHLCDALGEPPTCLPDACLEGFALLEAWLTAARAALPALSAADAMFATDVALSDEDGDLAADRLGTPEAPATWLMTLRFGAAWRAPVSATFDATRLPLP